MDIIRYGILNIGIKRTKIKNFEKKIELIKEYYYDRKIVLNPYLNSRNKLIRMIIEEEFPNIIEWNKIAQEEGYLSNISLEYIEGCNWRELRKKLIKEIKDILLSEIN